MATTTNYGWTTPDDTDLVKDGAAAIRTLGSSADTTVKNLSPGTTAGDLDYYTSGTAKARLAIGTAGQILKVNSGATAPEWATAAGSAIVLTGSADFTTSSAVNINDCFSATYLNYFIAINLTASSATDAELLFRMRASGTDDTSSNYTRQRIFQRSTTIGGTTNTATSMELSSISTTYTPRTYCDLYLNDPFIAKPTTMVSNANGWNSSNENTQFRISGVHNVSTSYDGITIYPSSGNITGKIRIYGYTLSQE